MAWQVLRETDSQFSSREWCYLRGDKVDELFGRAEVTGGANFMYWLLTDRQGSVRNVWDAYFAGVSGYPAGPMATVSYDAWGKPEVDEYHDLDAGRYLWNGREYSRELETTPDAGVPTGDGLYYHQARYYDPILRRFQQMQHETCRGPVRLPDVLRFR